MDFNSENFNGTSLSDISKNNYQQQMINNMGQQISNNMIRNIPNNNNNNNDHYDDNYIDNNRGNGGDNNEYGDNDNSSSITEKFTNKLYGNDDHIKEITRDILNGLTENNISLHDNESDKPKKKKNKPKKTYEDFGNNIEKEIETTSSDTKNFISTILKSEKIKDALIIFILFFILSQDMIKELFAQYFTSINPDETGKVGAKGVVVYGIIFAILFIIVKNFF